MCNSPASSSDWQRVSRHKPKMELGQRELPCFQISMVAGYMCYHVQQPEIFLS